MRLSRPGQPWPFMSTASFVKSVVMRQMRYVGAPKGSTVGRTVHSLVGLTALVQVHDEDAMMVRAQFDDMEARDGAVNVSVGWHAFSANEFEEIT